MKITVAGQDRSGDLGQAVAAEAARLQATGGIGELSPAHSARNLQAAGDANDYSRRFVELLRMRHGVRTSDYYIPRGPGLRGKVAVALKSILWKLLRYQHERITYQQNLINELAIDALEFQQNRLDGELADLHLRVKNLEAGRTKSAP